MKIFVRAVLALAIIGLNDAAQAEESPAYFIAQVQITDQTSYFNAYGANVGPLLEEAGAEILAATPVRQQLEGDWTGNWTVIIRFPSMEKALDWYRSDAYQAIRPLRLQSTDENNIILVPGFVPPQ